MNAQTMLLGDIDIVEILTLAFVLFFVGLVFYLRKEDRREGYPLEEDTTGRLEPAGAVWTPQPKRFRLPHGGGVIYRPSPEREGNALPARRLARWPGAPIEPTGDPMLAGIGPGSYAQRADTPDLNHEGRPKIRPLRLASGFTVSPRDTDPRGMSVQGADGRVAGKVSELWIDTSEQLIRYLEVALPDGAHVLAPMTMAVVERGSKPRIRVDAITAAQFAHVPKLANPEQVTLYEEERITAYFGAGYLYAMPKRKEALL